MTAGHISHPLAMKGRALVFGLMVALVACAPGGGSAGGSTGGQSTTSPPVMDESSTARLLFAGDLMMGRRVAPVLASDGPEVFEAVRHLLTSADVAAANLESPLTDLPHLSENPNALEADPYGASLLAGAGFDVMSLANNHSGDAGPAGVSDTIAALTMEGVRSLGAADNASQAALPIEMVVNGVRIAYLAFDVTGLGIAAGDHSPGVVPYTVAGAREAVQAAEARADVVAVSMHGGVEYLAEADPILTEVADDLVEWGADIVWGHGPHVAQPVSRTEDGAIVATSLGNFLFDQQRPATQTGLILEVLVSPDGAEAFRVGHVNHSDLRVSFTGWDPPDGSAALIEGEWWSPLATPHAQPEPSLPLTGFPLGDVIQARVGDVTGDGTQDLVVSYRHPIRANEVNALYPDRTFADPLGRSAHLGVFETETLEPIWAAGTLLRPVAEIVVCDGSIALAFDSLDDPTIVATGAWVWWDFGFATAPELAGPGTPTCVDVNRDGVTDPVVLRH